VVRADQTRHQHHAARVDYDISLRAHLAARPDSVDHSIPHQHGAVRDLGPGIVERRDQGSVTEKQRSDGKPPG
jgi:hypothetical protein